MSWAVLSSRWCAASVSVPTAVLVYTMGLVGSVLGMRSVGGANSVLPNTNPQVMHTLSPFVLSSLMFLLPHSMHFSNSLTADLL